MTHIAENSFSINQTSPIQVVTPTKKCKKKKFIHLLENWIYSRNWIFEKHNDFLYSLYLPELSKIHGVCLFSFWLNSLSITISSSIRFLKTRIVLIDWFLWLRTFPHVHSDSQQQTYGINLDVHQVLSR